MDETQIPSQDLGSGLSKNNTAIPNLQSLIDKLFPNNNKNLLMIHLFNLLSLFLSSGVGVTYLGGAGKSPHPSPSLTHIPWTWLPVQPAFALSLERLSEQPPCAVLSSTSVKKDFRLWPRGCKVEKDVQVLSLNREGRWVGILASLTRGPAVWAVGPAPPP